MGRLWTKSLLHLANSAELRAQADAKARALAVREFGREGAASAFAAVLEHSVPQAIPSA